MQIEAGKYYKTRDGRVVGPMKRWGEYYEAKLDGTFRLWLENGNHGASTAPNIPQRDLIAPAYPETGTLQEIGAKVGDVVEWIMDNKFLAHTVVRVNGDDIYLIENDDPHKYVFYWTTDSTHGSWRITTRASETKPSPVREVTRKEIVAGVYGKISVHELKSDDGYPMMAISSDEWHKNKTVHIPMSLAELTAAIATLTEIRDAMVQE